MSTRLRTASALVALAAVTGGCAPTPNTTGTPWCDDFGVLILEAQSAPGASLLPCVELMPKGWSPGTTHIDENGTTFTLHSTVAGDDAARVRLGGSCEIGGHVEVPTDEPDTQRFELVERIKDGYAGNRTYTFAGGCTSIDFAFRPEASAALVNEVSLALGFMPRDIVNEVVSDLTDGREQVDPVPSS